MWGAGGVVGRRGRRGRRRWCRESEESREREPRHSEQAARLKSRLQQVQPAQELFLEVALEVAASLLQQVQPALAATAATGTCCNRCNRYLLQPLQLALAATAATGSCCNLLLRRNRHLDFHTTAATTRALFAKRLIALSCFLASLRLSLPPCLCLMTEWDLRHHAS